MSTAPSSANSPPNSPLLGCFWMFVTGLMFVAVTGVVKWIGADVPAAQAAFLRYLMGLVFLVPVIPALRRMRLTRADLWVSTLRGAAHTVAVMCWFFAMSRIPVADVTSLNYLSPIYVTLGAALFLGERLSYVRLSAIAVAFVGALIILRPGFREVELGHLAMLVTGLCFGISYLTAKQLSGHISAAGIVAILSVTVTIGLAPFAWAVWVPVSWQDLAALFVVAILATAGHYTMALAFQAADVTVTQPMTFLQLIWAVLLGWFVFGEPVDAWVIVGGTVIVIAVVTIALREARLKRRAA
ncbi:MAG: DMT family transporter [Pseudomonadota bacterium]